MTQGISKLQSLLQNRCDQEDQYQELLEEHPWMLGGVYSEVERHRKFDDRRIPDFTAVRCYDGFRDVIELKQPFLRLFRESGEFNVNFTDAWDQAEKYIDFTDRQRSYLFDEKELRFENAKCLLIAGHDLSAAQLKEVRRKERFANRITVFTYDYLFAMAKHVLRLASIGGQRIEIG